MGRELPLLVGRDVVGYGARHGLRSPLEALAPDAVNAGLELPDRCLGQLSVQGEVTRQVGMETGDVLPGNGLKPPLFLDGVLNDLFRQARSPAVRCSTSVRWTCSNVSASASRGCLPSYSMPRQVTKPMW